MPDHLQVWCEVRESVAWHDVPSDVPSAAEIPPSSPRSNVGHGFHISASSGRDGVAHYIQTVEHARDPARAERISAALTRLRHDESAGGELDFATMAVWQSLVLGTENPEFRTGPAFAKGGREQYGIDADTRGRFERCLAESTQSNLPLAARAARTYLDVCFFHPFADGNARAALLALTFVLARGGVVLDEVGPIQRVARRADDPETALDFGRLVAILISATQRRADKTRSATNV